MSNEKDNNLPAPVEIPPPTVEEPTLTLMELLIILASRKGLIALCTLAGGVLATLVALALPNTFTASALLMPPQQTQQSAAAALAAQLGPLAAASNLGLKSPSDLYIGLIGSRTIADRIIDRFGLKSVYRVRTLTQARAVLAKNRRFSSGKDSLIKIDVDDVDPRRAAAIANAFVSELNAQNSRLAVSDAGQRRLFLENQLKQEESALAAAEDDMRGVQQKTGLVEVDGQTQVAIGSIAQVRAEIRAGEVALERLKMGATAENPEVIREERELDALRVQLKKLGGSQGDGDFLMSASAIPKVGLEYVRALRQLKYHEFLFEMLKKQYEAARLDENRAAPDLQVVDFAVPPDKKSGPPRSLIVLAGILFAAIGSSAAAYFLHALSDGRHAGRLRNLNAAATHF